MGPNPYVILTIAFAGVIHSAFSLSMSLLVLLSGHSISRRRSHARLLMLSGSFVLGSALTVLLLLVAATYFGLLLNAWAYPLAVLVLATLVTLSGLWVLFFYHRPGDGTALWVPRGFARYLTERTAHTKNPSESFVLGAAGVLFELPVTLWLLLSVAVILGGQGPRFQIGGLVLYAGLSTLALAIVFVLIGGGHTPASITRFRARNKRFIQVVAGLSLVAFGTTLFLNHLDVFLAAHGTLAW